MFDKRTLMKIIAVAAVTVAAIAQDQHAYAYSEKGAMLSTGEFLGVNDYLVSSDHKYFVIMQGDGNLVEYKGSGPTDNQGYVWGSYQVGNYALTPGSYFAIMQSDGNFVVYRGTGPADQHGWLWASMQDLSYAPPGVGNYFAIMQTDGNFVVYRGTGPADQHGWLWGSEQSLAKHQPPPQSLICQVDPADAFLVDPGPLGSPCTCGCATGSRVQRWNTIVSSPPLLFGCGND